MLLCRVEFFCDERKLGPVLRTLTGLAIGKPEVTPVANAVMKNGKVGAETSGSAPDMFAAYLKKHKIKEVDTALAKEFLGSIGKSPGSFSYLLRVSRERGYLTATNKVRSS